MLTANDYYPFGMLQPGRSYAQGGVYRYGFNGKKNDNEVKGTGNEQDYGMRIYDPRLGRFLSVDPLYHSYPELSSYQFASNSPISGIDMDGGEYLNANEARIHLNGTTVSLSLQNMRQVTQNLWKMRDESGHWPAGNIGYPTTVGQVSFSGVPYTPDNGIVP